MERKRLQSVPRLIRSRLLTPQRQARQRQPRMGRETGREWGSQKRGERGEKNNNLGKKREAEAVELGVYVLLTSV